MKKGAREGNYNPHNYFFLIILKLPDSTQKTISLYTIKNIIITVTIIYDIKPRHYIEAKCLYTNSTIEGVDNNATIL